MFTCVCENNHTQTHAHSLSHKQTHIFRFAKSRTYHKDPKSRIYLKVSFKGIGAGGGVGGMKKGRREEGGSI